MDSTERRRRNAKRLARRRNRLGMLVITFVVCLLFFVLLSEGVRLRAQIVTNDEETQMLQDAITAEKERAEGMESIREYVESEEFIKETARARFGLVEDGDILFRPAE
ncbi:MAG: septum formation initiator family protein [Lachnospiraceae bacterium]|nr:septum formation initiator family protein [Lachnospiraceae bacterium]MBQ6545146.1 septum formation initiator family protein [Lachnospiraceae bacterium]